VRFSEGLDCDRGILLVVLLEIEGELFGKLLGVDRDGHCLVVSNDPSKQTQWQAFLRKSDLELIEFGEVIADLRSFIMPRLADLRPESC
jgi:hypothetical protein